MIKTKWLHFGLIGCALGGFAAVAACSSNDIVDPGTDSGTQVDSGVIDPPDTGGGTPDAGTDASKPLFPKVALLHASTAFGPIKLCLAGKQTEAPNVTTELLPTDILPKSLPAVPVGAYAPLPFKSIDPSSYYLTAILIKPQAIGRITALKGGTTPNCGDFMKDAVLEPAADSTPNDGVKPIENKDFYVLATIQPGTFKSGKAYLGAATGCPKGKTPEEAVKCGPGYDAAKGNGRIAVFEYDSETNAGANNGVQFFHMAQEADPVLAFTGNGDPKVKPFINVAPVGGDAGPAADGRVYLGANSVSFASNVGGGVGTPSPALKTTAPISLINSEFGLTMAAGNDIAVQKVAVWAGAATGGVPAADYFKPGVNYAFIAVGDPSQPATIPGADGGVTTNYNTFRMLAVPNSYKDIVIPDLSNF